MKDLIISHVKDVDGVTPVILMNLWNKNYDCKLLDVHEMFDYLTELLTTDLSIYEHIYVVDLTIPQEIYPLIEQSEYRSKFLVFDHHETHEYARVYPYVTLNIEECGTTLFYQYIQSQGFITHSGLEEYIKAVKDLDLWTFEKNNNLLSPKLSSLFELLGEKRYIQEMTLLLQKATKTFTFTDFQEQLLVLEEENKKRYIDKREERMIRGILPNSVRVGMVYAEKYRSEIGNELLKRHLDLDVIIIVNMNGGISLRSRSVDVSKIAYHYGGGGHVLAAGIGISEEVKREVFQRLLKGEINIEN